MEQHFLSSQYAYLLTLKLTSIIIATPDIIRMSVSTLHSLSPLFFLGGRAKKKRRKRLKGFLVFSEGKKRISVKNDGDDAQIAVRGLN